MIFDINSIDDIAVHEDWKTEYGIGQSLPFFDDLGDRGLPTRYGDGDYYGNGHGGGYDASGEDGPQWEPPPSKSMGELSDDTVSFLGVRIADYLIGPP